MNHLRTLTLFALLFTTFTIIGCNRYNQPETDEMAPIASSDALEVELYDATDASNRLGTVTFLPETDGGVVALFKVKPNQVISPGMHAIHVHENASCDPKRSAMGQITPAGGAGGHFNPTNVGHGEDDGPHVGDSEEYNYRFKDDGSFYSEVQFPQLSFSGETSLFSGGGTAIIIHEGTDDKQSNPSGNAGSRIACGVIAKNR